MTSQQGKAPRAKQIIFLIAVAALCPNATLNFSNPSKRYLRYTNNTLGRTRYSIKQLKNQNALQQQLE